MIWLKNIWKGNNSWMNLKNGATVMVELRIEWRYYINLYILCFFCESNLFHNSYLKFLHILFETLVFK